VQNNAFGGISPKSDIGKSKIDDRGATLASYHHTADVDARKTLFIVEASDRWRRGIWMASVPSSVQRTSSIYAEISWASQ
jgi:hypothetical protein